MGTRRIKSPEKLEAERAARRSARRESVAERTNRLKSYIADRDARRRRRAIEKEVNEVIRGTEAHAAVTRAIEAGENPREALFRVVEEKVPGVKVTRKDGDGS